MRSNTWCLSRELGPTIRAAKGRRALCGACALPEADIQLVRYSDQITAQRAVELLPLGHARPAITVLCTAAAARRRANAQPSAEQQRH